MDIRSLYKIHKWLSVAALVAVLVWFVSGLVMALPPNWKTLSPGLQARLAGTRGPEFATVRVTVADAIAAVRAQGRGTGPVSSVRLRRFPLRLAYEIISADRTFLIDAISGEPFVVDRQLALAIAGDVLGPDVPLGPVTEEADPRDAGGGMPVFRIAAGDGKGTELSVNQRTAEVRYTDRLSRAASALAAWHDFSALGRWLPRPVIRLILLVFTFAGTLMSFAGALILLFQFGAWRRRRNATTADRDQASQ